LKTDINSTGGRELLRRMLEKTGMKLKKSNGKMMMLMERNDEVAQKASHLRSVKKLLCTWMRHESSQHVRFVSVGRVVRQIV
jgi:hypothetical protein